MRVSWIQENRHLPNDRMKLRQTTERKRAKQPNEIKPNGRMKMRQTAEYHQYSLENQKISYIFALKSKTIKYGNRI